MQKYGIIRSMSYEPNGLWGSRLCSNIAGACFDALICCIHSEILPFFQTDIQAPLNRQIVRSSEQIMYFVDLMDNMLTTFMGPQDNDLGKTDNRPRYLNNLGYLGEVVNFARTLYNLTK